jgi:drug/metabolite transporter superfamily protein YnfA
MTLGVTLSLLLLAALLEVGGDACIRRGLGTAPALPRTLFYLAGALILFLYGYLVNAPKWDFGRLLGGDVVLFFLVAQAVSWIVFGQKPSPSVWIGGTFIAVGGLIVALGAK